MDMGKMGEQRRQFSGPQEQLQLPNLGTEGTQARVPGRVEEFARRVHREGLPVARLWENKLVYGKTNRRW